MKTKLVRVDNTVKPKVFQLWMSPMGSVCAVVYWNNSYILTCLSDSVSPTNGDGGMYLNRWSDRAFESGWAAVSAFQELGFKPLESGSTFTITQE